MNINEYLNKNIKIVDPVKFAEIANAGKAIPENVLKEMENLKVVRVFTGGTAAHYNQETLNPFIVCVPEMYKDTTKYDAKSDTYDNEWTLYANELPCCQVI